MSGVIKSSGDLAPPYFSICIPQYNRTDFLIEACRAYAAQTFRDFEVCISDDCSTDGKTDELIAFLRSSGMRFTYSKTSTNLRYDGNLRAAIALSTGRYLLLMGNDDKLSTPTSLQTLHDELARVGEVAAAITNYRELSTNTTFRRMGATGVLGAGPEAALATFRSYSFVSGVIFDGAQARSEATVEVDGSEMYQMFLGARLVGRGGRFLAIDQICIDKDIQIAGQDVDSYRQLPRLQPCPIVKRPLPMGRLLEVVTAGLRPSVSAAELDSLGFKIACRLYAYTYPFWGVELRRVQSMRYAIGVLLALSPSDIARDCGMSWYRRLMLWPIYATTSTIALLTPPSVFDWLRPRLYRLAKRT